MSVGARNIINAKTNNRYEEGDDSFSQASPLRFSVMAKYDKGIENLRESNPFSELSPDKASKAFHKLFKKQTQNKRHSKPVKLQSVRDDFKNSLQRSRSA